MKISHYRNHKHLLGFTLVEIMIVIAIIGILAAVLYPSFGNIFERAKKTETKAEMRQIAQLIFDAQISQGKYLKDITTTSCSICPCMADPPYNNTESFINMPTNHQCYINWKRAIDNVLIAT